MTLRHRSRMIIPLLIAAVTFHLAGCAGTKTASAPADPQFLMMMRQARQAFDEGSVDRASTLYEQALERAHLTDDPASIRDASFNLAMCRIRSQRLDESKELLDEAMAEAARLGERPADLLLAQAKLAFLRGDLDGAGKWVEELLRSAPSPATPIERVQAHLLQGRIFAAKGDAARAREEYDAATSSGGSHGDVATEIEVRALMAAIHRLDGSPLASAEELDLQSELLRRTSRYREMTDALDRAGEDYSQVGEHARAFDRWYRAARSRLAQGETVRALKSAQRALSAAKAAGDPEAESRARTLLARIIETPEGSPANAFEQ